MSAQGEGGISNPHSPPQATPKTEVLSTTAQQVLKPNPRRVAVIFSNVSAINEFIDNVETVATDEGIQVDAGGGLIGLKIRDDGDLPKKAWFAVAASGTPKLRIHEIVDVRRGN